MLESLRDQKLIPQSVVIMVSSDGSRAMVLSALEAEPDEYLMKPFSQEQFSFRLKRALARRQALESVFTALTRDDLPALVEACARQADTAPLRQLLPLPAGRHPAQAGPGEGRPAA